jgi:hypothetical protein
MVELPPLRQAVQDFAVDVVGQLLHVSELGLEEDRAQLLFDPEQAR